MIPLSTVLDFSKIGTMECVGVNKEDLIKFSAAYELFADRITIYIMTLSITEDGATLPPLMFDEVAEAIDTLLPDLVLTARAALWAVIVTELCKFAYRQWEHRRREEKIKASGIENIFHLFEQANKSINQNPELN
jgi:hypothetical protein